jgi:predicted phosphoribosyltransferase
MRAAVHALRRHHPKRIVIAVPVGARDTCRELGKEADEIICGQSPPDFGAVGMWYQDFAQTTDAEVAELLDEAARQFLAGTL